MKSLSFSSVKEKYEGDTQLSNDKPLQDLDSDMCIKCLDYVIKKGSFEENFDWRIITKEGDYVYKWFQSIKRQYHLPSCVAHSIAELIQWENPNCSPCIAKIYLDLLKEHKKIQVDDDKSQKFYLSIAVFYSTNARFYEEGLYYYEKLMILTSNEEREEANQKLLEKEKTKSVTTIPIGPLLAYEIKFTEKMGSRIINILKEYNQPITVGLKTGHVITVFGYHKNEDALCFKDSNYFQVIEHHQGVRSPIQFGAISIAEFDEIVREAYILLNESKSIDHGLLAILKEPNLNNGVYGDSEPPSSINYHHILGTDISPYELPGIAIKAGSDARAIGRLYWILSKKERRDIRASLNLSLFGFTLGGSLDLQTPVNENQERIKLSKDPLLEGWEVKTLIWGFETRVHLDLENVIQYSLNGNDQFNSQPINAQELFHDKLEIVSKSGSNQKKLKEELFKFCQKEGIDKESFKVRKGTKFVFKEWPGKQTDKGVGLKFTFTFKKEKDGEKEFYVFIIRAKDKKDALTIKENLSKK